VPDVGWLRGVECFDGVYSFMVGPDLIMVAVFGVNAVFYLDVTLSVWTRLRSGSFDSGLRRYGAAPPTPICLRQRMLLRT
jgi:hypothetical protein